MMHFYLFVSCNVFKLGLLFISSFLLATQSNANTLFTYFVRVLLYFHFVLFHLLLLLWVAIFVMFLPLYALFSHSLVFCMLFFSDYVFFLSVLICWFHFHFFYSIFSVFELVYSFLLATIVGMFECYCFLLCSLCYRRTAFKRKDKRNIQVAIYRKIRIYLWNWCFVLLGVFNKHTLTLDFIQFI